MKKSKKPWAIIILIGLAALLISPWLLTLCIIVGAMKALHNTD